MIALAGCGNQLHEFSECLTDKGVKMYGAFWCPHCAQQKSMFGSGFERVTYIECSLPDKSGQTQACKDANIQQYPTWEFSDGSRKEGVQTLGELSKRSGCALEQ
jgi:hypothetical protein